MARVAATKEFLTEEQKLARNLFATNFGNKDDAWWRSVIFSDEKSFG